MEPIINPWFIYWINCFNNIAGLCTIVAIISGIGFIVCLIGYLMSKYDSCSEESYPAWKHALKIIIPIFFICLLFAIFVPSKETMLQMYVARNITYQRVEKIVGAGKNLKDELKKDIIDIILAVKKEDVKERDE